MPRFKTSFESLRLDERHHVELPLLDQLAGLNIDTRTLIQR
jgi:hypothetical protein